MSEWHTVQVNVPGHAYAVLIGRGMLGEIGRELRRLSASSTAALVSDSVVTPLYAGVVGESLAAAGFRTVSAVIPAGETHKHLQTLGAIYDQILPAGIDRSTPIVALGGGVVGDMSGFAAATILRGIPFIQVPTTLLSMVDASVGGKTGIDHAVGKNLIGAFHQPLGVFIDPQVLTTLPPRELRSGLAECIKHEVIRDADGFAALERNIDRAASLDLDYLGTLLAHNVAIKATVVASDPFEKGDRAHLNFGHTFGHAIETVSQYTLAHGECVGLGMIAASRAALALGMFDQNSTDRLIAVLRRAGLPTGGLTLPVDAIVSAMIYDKKVRAGKVRFVLPDRIGHVVIRDDVPPEIVRRAVESLRD